MFFSLPLLHKGLWLQGLGCTPFTLATKHYDNPLHPYMRPTHNKGLFEKRFKELDESVRTHEALNQQLKRDQRDLDERLQRYEEEREKFEEERLQWKEELERTRTEVIEQNDRLTVLSEQLVGAKVRDCMVSFNNSNYIVKASWLFQLYSGYPSIVPKPSHPSICHLQY